MLNLPVAIPAAPIRARDLGELAVPYIRLILDASAHFPVMVARLVRADSRRALERAFLAHGLHRRVEVVSLHVPVEKYGGCCSYD